MSSSYLLFHPDRLAEVIQGAEDTSLWGQKGGGKGDTKMTWAATERNGGGMTIAGHPCTTTGCGPHLAMDLRLWIGDQTTQNTCAVSLTSHPLLITVTPTTIPTLPHTPDTTRVHRQLTEGERRVGAGLIIIIERWRSSCAGLLIGRVRGTGTVATEDEQ